MMIRICSIVLILFVSNICRTLDCFNLPTSKPNELVQFLKTQGREADPECVSKAITRLGDFRSNLGTDVLIDLLDFKRPESDRETFGVADGHDKFPAVPALYSIGLPSVPRLIAKLQEADTTELVRSNAIRTIVVIYSANPSKAITVLLDAARIAKTQDQAVRLESCAQDAVKQCGNSRKTQCEAALMATP
jgi:hypothetical protein